MMWADSQTPLHTQTVDSRELLGPVGWGLGRPTVKLRVRETLILKNACWNQDIEAT